MTSPSLLYLSRADVEALALPVDELVEAVRRAFVEKAEGRAEMPPKPGIHPAEDSFLHAMPAHLSGLRAAGLKWIAAYPANKAKGLPYITGLVVLNDVDTGLPIAVLDATWITAMRTAAATALAVRHLARRDPRALALVGLGVQARSHARVLAASVPSLRRIQAYDHRPENARRFRDELAAELDVVIELATGPLEAVRGADVVVTAGPILRRPRPFLGLDALADGVLVAPLDFDSSVSGETLRGADALVTDDAEQFRYYRSLGYFRDAPDPDAELGDVIVGRARPRKADRDRIVCACLGLAIEDVAVGAELYRRAVERGVGTRLPL